MSQLSSKWMCDKNSVMKEYRVDTVPLSKVAKNSLNILDDLT